MLAAGVVVPRLYLAIMPGDEDFFLFFIFGKHGGYYKNAVSHPVLPLLLLSAKCCNFPTKAAAFRGSSTLLENSLPYLIARDICKQVFCVACW